jgi:flagellum-specific ATP synthase
MNDIAGDEHRSAALTIRRLLAAHAEHEDLLSVGAYRRGTNRAVDAAVEMRELIDALLRQPVGSAQPFAIVIEQLVKLAAQCEARMNVPANAGVASP